MSGRWVLDVDDYASQSSAWLKSVGVPLDSLDMGGGQRLDFTDDFFHVSSDLSVSAVVHGVSVGWTDGSAGGGDLIIDDGGFHIDNFAWNVRPSLPPGGAPVTPAFDWNQPISVRCQGGVLELRGGGAPLTGRFVRP